MATYVENFTKQNDFLPHGRKQKGTGKAHKPRTLNMKKIISRAHEKHIKQEKTPQIIEFYEDESYYESDTYSQSYKPSFEFQFDTSSNDEQISYVYENTPIATSIEGPTTHVFHIKDIIADINSKCDFTKEVTLPMKLKWGLDIRGLVHNQYRSIRLHKAQVPNETYSSICYPLCCYPIAFCYLYDVLRQLNFE